MDDGAVGRNVLFDFSLKWNGLLARGLKCPLEARKVSLYLR